MFGIQKRAGVMAALAGMALGAVCWGQAPIVSDFTSGDDGWGVEGGQRYFHDVGGNPDGFLEFQDDADGAGIFTAPAKFLGNLSGYDEGSLRFDLKNTVNNGGDMLWGYGRVQLWSGATVVSLNAVPLAWIGDWTRFTLSLRAADWGVDQQEWESLLSNVTAIQIQMDAQWDYYDRAGIDNFRLAPIEVAAEAETWGAVKALYR